MKNLAFAVLALCMLVFPARAKPSVADEAVAKSMALAEDKKYDRALKILDEAEKREPDNADFKVATARIYSWQGRYDMADTTLQPVLTADPHNSDAQLAAAYTDYYRDRLDSSEKGFAAIVQAHPDDADAIEGLKLVQSAKQTAPGFTWILDGGFEHSSFARRPQPNWSNEFVQITRQFDQGTTGVHARIEHSDEFSTTDNYYELGADHIFTPYLNGYLYAGHTVDASFSPTWRTTAGGNVRLNAPQATQAVFWLTLDAREDNYNQAAFATINPGVRAELNDWALASNLVVVRQWGGAADFGGNVRIDTPVWDRFHFYGGFSDAPDTENAVTVYTASIYGGASYDVSDSTTLRLGYTHDDRENSYIRHVVDASATYRY
jgi:YaiO family outer membrane protein